MRLSLVNRDSHLREIARYLPPEPRLIKTDLLLKAAVSEAHVGMTRASSLFGGPDLVSYVELFSGEQLYQKSAAVFFRYIPNRAEDARGICCLSVSGCEACKSQTCRRSLRLNGLLY